MSVTLPARLNSEDYKTLILGLAWDRKDKGFTEDDISELGRLIEATYVMAACCDLARKGMLIASVNDEGELAFHKLKGEELEQFKDARRRALAGEAFPDF